MYVGIIYISYSSYNQTVAGSYLTFFENIKYIVNFRREKKTRKMLWNRTSEYRIHTTYKKGIRDEIVIKNVLIKNLELSQSYRTFWDYRINKECRSFLKLAGLHCCDVVFSFLFDVFPFNQSVRCARKKKIKVECQRLLI